MSHSASYTGSRKPSANMVPWIYGLKAKVNTGHWLYGLNSGSSTQYGFCNSMN